MKAREDFRSLNAWKFYVEIFSCVFVRLYHSKDLVSFIRKWEEKNLWKYHPVFCWRCFVCVRRYLCVAFIAEKSKRGFSKTTNQHNFGNEAKYVGKERNINWKPIELFLSWGANSNSSSMWLYTQHIDFFFKVQLENLFLSFSHTHNRRGFQCEMKRLEMIEDLREFPTLSMQLLYA